MRYDEFKKRLALGDTTPMAIARSQEDEIFISYLQLRQHGVPYSRVHIRRLIERGLFPAPDLLSPNRIAWRLSKLGAWKGSRPCATRVGSHG